MSSEAVKSSIKVDQALLPSSQPFPKNFAASIHAQSISTLTKKISITQGYPFHFNKKWYILNICHWIPRQPLPQRCAPAPHQGHTFQWAPPAPGIELPCRASCSSVAHLTVETSHFSTSITIANTVQTGRRKEKHHVSKHEKPHHPDDPLKLFDIISSTKSPPTKKIRGCFSFSHRISIQSTHRLWQHRNTCSRC